MNKGERQNAGEEVKGRICRTPWNTRLAHKWPPTSPSVHLTHRLQQVECLSIVGDQDHLVGAVLSANCFEQLKQHLYVCVWGGACGKRKGGCCADTFMFA